MKRHSSLFSTLLAYFSIYPLLLLILIGTAFTCFIASSLIPDIPTFAESTPELQVKRLRALPTPSLESNSAATVVAVAESFSATSAAAPAKRQSSAAIIDPVAHNETTANDAALAPITDEVASAATSSSLPESMSPTNSTTSSGSALPETEDVGSTIAALPTPLPTPTIHLVFEFPTRERRATSTPRAESILDEFVNSLMSAVTNGNGSETQAERSPSLPTLTATPTGASTSTPTATPTESSTPTQTATPTETSTPTITPTFTNTPIPTETPTALPPSTSTPVPFPTETPLPTATPKPEYNYLLNEFYNSPTTNSFIVVYVAIVDVNEIPIGDLKIVGTRLDHNLTYESPLSKWHFEGYNAPGEVIKSGNVKFEPPGGIESTKWLIHLADANGNRLSDDVPFHTDPNDKQWYFVKFRRNN